MGYQFSQYAVVWQHLHQTIEHLNMSLKIAAEYLGYTYGTDFFLGVGDDDIRWQIEPHPTEAELRAVELPAMRQKASDDWTAAAPGYINEKIFPASLMLLYSNQLEDATAEAVSDFIGDVYRAIEDARADLIEATLETVVTIAPVWPIYEGPQL